MFVTSKMTRTGEPKAFIKSTLVESPVRVTNYMNKERVSKVYTMDAFWVSVRRNRRLGLNFGSCTFTFSGSVDGDNDYHHNSFDNLTYEQLLEFASKNPPYNSVSFRVGVVSASVELIWDGQEMWMPSGKSRPDLLSKMLPQMITDYAKLPAAPTGADGWYKMV